MHKTHRVCEGDGAAVIRVRTGVNQASAGEPGKAGGGGGGGGGEGGAGSGQAKRVDDRAEALWGGQA